jgi:hypothetical protein
MEYGLLFCSDVVLKRLPENLKDLAAELWQFIQAAHAVVGPRPLARQRHLAPPISPTSELG